MSEGIASVPSQDQSPALSGSDSGDVGFDEGALREAALAALGSDTEEIQAEGETESEQEPAKVEAEKKPEPEADKETKLTKREEEIERAAAGVTAKARRLRARVEEFTASKQAFEAEKTAFAQEKQSFQALRQKASSSPLEALQELGWSFEQLTAYVAQDGNIPVEKRLKDMESLLTEQTTAKLKEVEEVQARLAQEQLYAKANTYKVAAENRTFAALRSGDFPLAARVAGKSQEDTEGLVAAVLGTITAEYRKTKKALAPEDVLRTIEGRLQEQRKLLLGDEAPQGGAAPKPAKPEAGKEPRVLSNADAGERTVRPSSDAYDPDVDPERLRKQALSMLTG